jgi:lipopolysaccharide/colanic/teichoic acid biosynthesis glycosyltransferase
MTPSERTLELDLNAPVEGSARFADRVGVVMYNQVDAEGGANPASGRFEYRSSAFRGLYRNSLKRAFDILAVLIGAPIVLPVCILLALLIRRDGGSVFYTQKRIGLDGREFRIYKFRSMVPDAARRLAEHLASDPAARAEWDVSQKLKKDPRITTIGRIIRKASLDELPQLLNVLKGDMSLVGPRPMMPEQRALYPGSSYYALRPGLTGYWQVSARNDSSFADRAKFDNDYARDLSFGTDMKVLLKTVGVVARCTGY